MWIFFSSDGTIQADNSRLRQPFVWQLLSALKFLDINEKDGKISQPKTQAIILWTIMEQKILI